MHRSKTIKSWILWSYSDVEVLFFPWNCKIKVNRRVKETGIWVGETRIKQKKLRGLRQSVKHDVAATLVSAFRETNNQVWQKLGRTRSPSGNPISDSNNPCRRQIFCLVSISLRKISQFLYSFMVRVRYVLYHLQI